MNHEIEHFSQQAYQWWDPEGPMKTLHVINPCRLAFVESVARKRDQAQILDVGCGAGLLSEAMHRSKSLNSANITGIDPSGKLIDVARMHAASQGLDIDYQAKTLTDWNPEARFDVITAMEVLEHVEDPCHFLGECAKRLAPDGVLIVSTLNRHLWAFLGAIVMAEHVLGLVPKGTHRYEQFIKPSTLARYGQEHHLTLLQTSGIRYNPLTQTANLTRDLSINYLMAFTPSCNQGEHP